MRVIIAGGRDFSDYERLSERVLHILSSQDQVTIVCGEARVADSLGKRLVCSQEGVWWVCRFDFFLVTSLEASGKIFFHHPK